MEIAAALICLRMLLSSYLFPFHSVLLEPDKMGWGEVYIGRTKRYDN